MFVYVRMKVGGVGTESGMDGMNGIKGFLLKSAESELSGMVLFSWSWRCQMCYLKVCH